MTEIEYSKFSKSRKLEISMKRVIRLELDGQEIPKSERAFDIFDQ